MNSGKLVGLGLTALKSNFTSLDRPYKLTFSITYACQSRCLTCVKPDEVILGDNISISNVCVGNHAVGSRGLNEVSQTFSRPYSGKLLRIKASGLLPIEITPEHPLLIMRPKTTRHTKSSAGNTKYYHNYDFGKPIWKEAKDIIRKGTVTDGDYLCTPILERTMYVRELDLKPFNKGRGIAISKAKGYSLNFPLDSETAWLLGIYAAEGYFSSNGARFNFNVTEINLHDRVEKIANRLGYSVTKTEKNNCTTCCLSSHVISRALVEWCGKGALNKKMPDFILLNKDESVLRSFIKGWEEGDGHWDGDAFIGSTVSKTLALQLQLAYASLGIMANISIVKKEGTKMFYDKPIHAHDVYIIKYSRTPGITYSKRIGNYFVRPIRKISSFQYEGTVHNIETSDNTYLVSNAVVHNCNIWQIKPTGELTIDEVREFAKKNNYFKWIEITGGEPFLRSDIVDIVRAFNDFSKGLYVLTMPTNSLCNQDMVAGKIEEILKLGIPKVSITISLDGYRELHDRIRGIPGNFDRAMGMARRLKELQRRHGNLFFVFGYTMSKFNEGQLLSTVQKVRDELPWVTANDFHVNAAQTSDIYYKNSQMSLKSSGLVQASELKQFLAMRSFRLGAIPIIENAFLKWLSYYVMTGNSPMKGRSLDASLFMDSYGNVFPSIMWDRKIGNMRDVGYDLTKVWRSAEAEEARKLIREGKEPRAWTACEAYQTLVGNIGSLIV
jgi:MoaA/NifB/PqqE/SkfB family radical SAM enzyme